jgi:1-acyl-sn-glycerol-3-phosphate acyltransferase
MLDVFIFLAADARLRGTRHRRPIQVVYWKQLEDNFVCRLLFQQAGFIPVQMADNGHGTANEYDKASFKALWKQAKYALTHGYDLGVLPEGQLNPDTTQGLLPLFSGAFRLAQFAQCPIRMWALYGAHQLWHPTEGMVATHRHVIIQRYDGDWYFSTADDFVNVMEQVVGEFGRSGTDLPWEQFQALQEQYTRASTTTTTAMTE